MSTSLLQQQTQIEKNSPPTLNPKRSYILPEAYFLESHRYIMLGCLVLGRNFFYLGVDIQKVPNISFLQEEIKKKKENDFRDIDPDNLKLWKVEIPAEDSRLEPLMSNTEIDIDSIADELGGAEFLNPLLKITRYFPETYNPPEEHVHILVKPQFPTNTGKCLSMFCFLNNKFTLSNIQ
jgi:hypothetical protein